MSRALSFLIALVLAIVGTSAVLAYVHGADNRALQGMKATTVLEAGQQVPQGTSAAAALKQGLIHPENMAKKELKPEPPIDPNVREVQDRLQRALGLKVHIEDHNGRGKVIIEYAKLEDFDSLLENLAGE